MDAKQMLEKKAGVADLDKLFSINAPELHDFVAFYVDLMVPDRVFVCSDDPEDIAYIREEAIRHGEEQELKIKGHTIHFDNAKDQARDKQNTRLMTSRKSDFGAGVNVIDRDQGLSEMHSIMKGIVRPGGTLYVLFFNLGPCGSELSIPCVQLTDSAYVAHSENLLYRQGYSEFIRLGPKARYFKFVHSQGELEGAVSKNIHQRRVFIDLDQEVVYSANTQYGGNTIGLKKLAFRLAIQRAYKEGWLAEHMFLMGVHGPKSRPTYFAGAFPSLCGKTSTSMIPWETIVGDDLAYLFAVEGEVKSVNVEKGMFGIIQGINKKDDPVLWNTLHSPGEIIFSNVLKTEEGEVFWIDKDGPEPPRGVNHQGEWTPDKKDQDGKPVPVSHPNARFTLEIGLLENRDTELENPDGVTVSGIIYGGRDSDTCPPVEESFDWAHGVITKGASLESETTAATLGQGGVRKFNLMAILDFLSIPLARYIQNHLSFGKKLEHPPRIYGVNYFLKDENDEFLNDKMDKAVWLKWMDLRVRGEVEAVQTPTGLIPRYQDLKPLFKNVLNNDYSEEDYESQFTVRVKELISKLDRIEEVYKDVADPPAELHQVLSEQRNRLLKAREEHGEYISPLKF